MVESMYGQVLIFKWHMKIAEKQLIFLFEGEDEEGEKNFYLHSAKCKSLISNQPYIKLWLLSWHKQQ